MIIGLLVAAAGVGVLSALLFNAAVYALPVVVGIWTLQQVIALGGGAVGGIASGMLAGAVIYAVGHVVFEDSRSEPLRIAITVLFVVPAILAGYNLAAALLLIGMAPGFWAQVLAGMGALVVGASALARLWKSPTSQQL